MKKWLAIALTLVVCHVPAAVSAVDLTPGESTHQIPLHAEYLIDETSTLTISDIRNARFTPNEDPTLNLGTRDGHIWLRISFQNPHQQPGSWLLTFNRAVLNTLEVYDAGAQKVFDIADPGVETAALNQFGTLASELTLAPGAQETYYIRYQGPNSSALPLTVETQTDLLSKRSSELTYFLAIAAGVLTLVLYNAVMYGLTGDRSFLYYTLAQTAVLSYFAHIEGFTTAYLWPDNPAFGAPLAPMLGALISASSVAFARSFLETRQRSPSWDRILSGLLILSVAVLLMAILNPLIGLPPKGVLLSFTYLTNGANWILFPILAVVAALRWQKWNWPLIPAWFAMSLFVFYTSAVFAGLVAITDWHRYLYGVVAYSEAGFLAVALALKMRAIRRHSLETERALSASLERELAETRRARELALSRAAAITELAQHGALMRAASHDSRQMVGTLKQSAFALEQGQSPETLGELLNEVADHLDGMLNTTDGGSYSGGFSDASIALDCVTGAEIVRPLRLMFERAAQEKGIDLRICTHDVEVVTDRALLLRVLANLASNAIKYCHSGGVMITARKRAGAILFQVIDTGPGMSEQQTATLLSAAAPSERFEANGEGTGTGWKVIRDVASRLQGELELRSNEGRGTAVTLRLPQGEDHRVRVCFAHGSNETRPEIQHLNSHHVVVTTSLLERITDPTDLIIVDLDEGGPHRGVESARQLVERGHTVAVSTYDHDQEIRAEISAVTPYIIYKPLRAQTLAVLGTLSIRYSTKT